MNAPRGKVRFMWERITAIGTVILIILAIVSISQGSTITWLHWPGFMLPLIIVCGLVIAAILNFRTAKLHARTANKDISKLGQINKKHIYIGPGGIPVSIVDGKIRVDLEFFSCTPAQLLHVKVYIGASPLYATLSDGEPEDIRAGDVFTKSLETKLESGMRSLLVLERAIQVHGTATFSAGVDDKTFHFDAVPLFLGRD
jgi:hypothetical protein